MPIVSAAAVFAHSKSKNLSDKIEQEMLKAADKAQKQGKSNSQIRADMMTARQKVKDDLDAIATVASGRIGK